MSNIKVNPTELLKMSCGYWKSLTEVETWIDENQEMIDNISRNPKLPFRPFDPLTGFLCTQFIASYILWNGCQFVRFC